MNQKPQLHTEPDAPGTQTSLAREIYAILVTTCGALPSDEASFVHAFKDSHYPLSEWRFRGHLGFGGKYRHPSMKVDCYPEDLTAERQAMIEMANEQLKALREGHVQV